MKACLLLLLVAVATSSTIHDGDIFDMYDVKEIIETKELRQEVFGCVMGRSPCDRYQLIKDRAPNIIRTGCADCTPEQKAKFLKFYKKFEMEHNDSFKQLEARFQPWYKNL